jgi:hypothetical protein
MARRKAATSSLKSLVAVTGLSHEEWSCEAGDSLSDAPSDLDVEWLLKNGRVKEASSG